jgi:predicted phage terminase large subunit-like protein
MAYILRSGEKAGTDLMSAKEKFTLLPPQRRLQIISSLPDEEVAKLEYDWDWLGRPKQLAPNHAKSRATSFCMCDYLEAQSKTTQKLKLEQFPPCQPNKRKETLISYEAPQDEGWQTLLLGNGSSVWIKEVEHEEPKVCKFRQDWSMWVLLAGRGFGKTRVGAEIVREMVETNQAKRIAIISPTAADARDVVVEGESGLLSICPQWNKPVYESTKRRVTWPNGAMASLFSAEEPERLRGPQFDFAWMDEVAGYDANTQQMTFDMLQFGLRLGKNPRCVVTTTPKPTPLIQNFVKMAKNPENRVIVTTGSTYENRSNLAAPFMRQVTAYEGTNLGRQEIYAELIDIEESGIIKRSWFKKWPATKPMPMIEFVLQSYDTAFTEKTTNDPTACTVYGVFRPSPDEPHCVMIIDAWKDFLKYPELRKKAAEDYKNTYGEQEAKVDLMVIEDKGSGIALIQDLQRAGLPIRKYNPGKPDKVMRLHAVSHLVYNGRVYIPESKKVPGEFVTWAEDFLREVCAFPNSEHDDYVDTFSQALAVYRDQEWISVDPEPEKDPFADEDRWDSEDSSGYSNPYAA